MVDGFEKPYADCFLSPMKPDIFNRGPAIDELSDLELYNEKDKPVFTGHYCLPPNIPKVSEMWFAWTDVTCDKPFGVPSSGNEKTLLLI